MSQLRSSSPFFNPGPPAEVGQADVEIMAFLKERVEGEILDMGGGRGAYAHALQECGYQITLAEKNPTCLEEVQRLGIPVLDMNVKSWGDLKGMFDTVILIEVLEHVEDPLEFLGNILSCARKKVLLTVPCNDDFEELFRLGLTYNHIAVSDHIQQFTSRDITQLFEKLGCRYEIHKGGHLFPQSVFPILRKTMKKHPAAELALLPIRLLNKLGVLEKQFPVRIFAEVYPSVKAH